MYQLANELKKDSDYGASFIVFHDIRKKFRIFDGMKVFIVYSLPERLWFIDIMNKPLLYLFRNFNAGADLYIQRAAGWITGVTALYCKLFRKKFIYMVASLMDLDGKYADHNGLQGRMYEYGLRHADVVVVQSVDQQKLLKERYGKDSVIIKNSFPVKDMDDVPKDIILWVGSSQHLKQPEKFLALARSFPQKKFIMIMPKNDKKLWEEIADEAKMIGNLELIEQVPFSEIDKYYQRAKIFVNTSTFEGFANTLIQAAMFGAPIVTLNVNPDNFLTEWDCGYCAGGDDGRLKTLMQKLFEDGGDWQAKSKNARKYVLENHDISKNIEKLKALIASEKS